MTAVDPMTAPPSEPLFAVPLLEAEVSSDPFEQFARWYADAAQVMWLPEAMALATATTSGRPSVRMVLMKSWDERGFVFHTNYGSRKGHDIEENPFAALLFHWDPLGRQVRIEGPIEQIDPEDSDDHFATRPRGAQLGAHASWQSQPIADRDQLDERVQAVTRRFEGAAVPRPWWWGGLRVRAEVIEFWQNREDRLHDRLLYRRPDGDTAAFSMERLQP